MAVKSAKRTEPVADIFTQRKRPAVVTANLSHGPRVRAAARRFAPLDSAYVGTLFPRVKTKLTLYVDQAAVKRGKLWARRRKLPLSRVVEEHLNRLVAGDAGERFLAKWQGKFHLSPDAAKDPRAAAIMAKHVR
ncbi:MAG: hypothetical protein RLZZ15_720 [Verrucomicrobiota bacterium]|jgi:hypothetical protein